MAKPLLLIAFFCSCIIASYAQQKTSIRLKNATVELQPTTNTAYLQEIEKLAFYEGNFYVIITLKPSTDIKQLTDAGITLHSPINSNTYFATITKKTSLQNTAIEAIGYIKPTAKYNNATTITIEKDKSTYIAVNYFGITATAIKSIVELNGITTFKPKLATEGFLYCNYNNKLLNKIAQFPFINALEVTTLTPTILGNETSALHGIDAVSATQGRRLTGEGITIGHGDLGLSRDHIDESCKVIDRYTGSGNFHGVLTHGVATGAGIINEKYKGMAPKSPTVSALFTDVLLNTPTYITDYNMVATNNSYFAGLGGCPGNGVYNNLSVFVDAQTASNPSNLHLFAAGNDGGIPCSPYPVSFGTVKSGFQTGKNVLTVGSINAATYTISPFSSRGPLKDGRLKPEIVAKGQDLIGPVPVNIYDYNSGGTSHSTPVVTGTVALLQQRHKQLYGTTANSAVAKALLCNSADDLGNPGPDYTYGFGMVNARKTIEALEANQIINGTITSTGNTNTHNITVPVNVKQLKVMLYWIDAAGNIATANSIVNDLDIKVITPSSVIHQPLILNTAPSNVNDIATLGRDSINNIEQCVLVNPSAGNYSITVNGYNLPIADQQYVVVYYFEKNDITVEAPFGNEKLIPNEATTIRWNTASDNTNTFTVSYSNNNGVNFTILDAAVPATARSLAWTVPNDVTTTALIKVERNGTALKDSSDYNFTILGQPTLTVSPACIGAVQLNWNSIAGATSYEIMRLVADSMQTIATTTSTAYLLTGLPTTTTEWLTVRAVLNGTTGRRAIAQSIVANSGACADASFDNDIALLSINKPTTGRHLTNTAANFTTNINVTLKNNDDAVSGIPFTIHYSINGGATVTENITAPIAAGALISYTFATHNPTTLPADYTIKVWVTKTGDVLRNNDTVTTLVRLLPNAALTLPYTDDLESTTTATYKAKTIGFTGNDRLDFNTNVSYGRARSFVNTGFAKSGSKAITLDQLNASGYALDTLMATFNLSNYDTATHQLRAEVYIKDNGAEAGTTNKVWIRGSDNNNWIEAYNLGTDQSFLGQYKLINLNVNDLFNNATPKQNVSTSFQLAVGQEGSKPATLVNPFDRSEDGYTIDDYKIVNALNDIAVKRIIAPAINSCALSSSNPITIEVKNYSNTPQSNVQVSYRINNGVPVTETITSLTANQTLNYTFSTTANLGAYIDYSIDVWCNLSTDNYKNNDSILRYELHNSPLVTSYPYLERFENDNGNWYAKGTNNSWAWGTPAQAVINKAPNGTKAWVTGLTTGYRDNETSYLNSPCFDLSSLTNPMLSFSHITRIEDDCPCDYTWMEYSTNAGLTWQKLGSAGQGTNWYDNTTVQAWQLSKVYWHVASIPIPTNSATTKFRFVMQSDGGVTYGGVGVDDVHIYESAPIYTGATIANGLNQPINGSNWLHYNNGGLRIASLNANGNDLGNTAAQVHLFVGAVRSSNGQYYANRNIVLQPTTPPSSNVSVRFYFTDAEVEAVLNATGCGACTKPNDAYEFGITKYSGPVVEENGTLADNTLPASFILPGAVDIIPYENGYYAQYDVSSFSEFWLNNGGIGFNQALPLAFLQFTVTKQNTIAVLQWNTTNEINLSKYEIESSIDGIQFRKLGEAVARNGAQNSYSFTDPLLNSIGIKTIYYRLKVINNSNNYFYSPTRTIIVGDDKLQLTLSPNPSKGIVTINANTPIQQLQIINSQGKIVFSDKKLITNTTLQLAHLAKGVYTIKLTSQYGSEVRKLVME